MLRSAKNVILAQKPCVFDSTPEYIINFSSFSTILFSNPLSICFFYIFLQTISLFLTGKSGHIFPLQYCELRSWTLWHRWAERTYQTLIIFYKLNFATWFTRRFNNDTSMLGVLYPYACQSFVTDSISLYIIPSAWAYFRCISRWKAMRRPSLWDRHGVYPTPFLYHHSRVVILFCDNQVILL